MIQHASIDDSTLFERITRHDAEAFGIVMRRYAGALYAFAFRIVGDTLAAEDIVQEVFINLWEKRRKLSPGPSLRNFLYLAVRNLSLNHLQSNEGVKSSELCDIKKVETEFKQDRKKMKTTNMKIKAKTI